MSSTFPQRIAFEDHRFMRAVDLEDEQLYHLQRRWQHNLALHSWGILCGLEVRNNGGDLRQPKVLIHPGMALDGYGRELVLTEPLDVLVRGDVLDPAVTYDVWLTWNVSFDNGIVLDIDECPSSDLDPCCAPPQMNLRRLVEKPRVSLQRTSARQSGSVTEPREVPRGDLQFSPQSPMKFDALSQWPVFLCRLECRGTKWTVDDSERHYAGLIAERIEVPFQSKPTDESQTRGTAILNGGHPERKDWRFAVLDVPDHHSKDERDAARTLPDEVPAPFSIRAIPRGDKGEVDTEIRLQAERVVAESDIVMQAGAGLQFEATPVGEESILPTSGWGIYRSFHPPKKVKGSTPAAGAAAGSDSTGTLDYIDDNTKQFADVLQISMPQSNHALNSVAIGAVDSSGKFSTILEVVDDQSVNVFGRLRVHGTIYGDTTDLPPLDTAKARDYFRQWLTDLMSSKDPEGKSFVTAIAAKADAVMFKDGLIAIDDAQEKVLYSALANQIIALMPTEFATKIKSATDPEQKAFYAALANQIIALMPTEFASEIKSATDPEQKAFYAALANQIITLMPTEFATKIKSATDPEQKAFYTALANQIIALMPTEFASEIKSATDPEQKAFYTALAKQIIELMPGDFAIAVGSADEAEQKTFYTSLAKQIIELMPGDFATAVGSADEADRKTFYTSLAKQIIKLMPAAFATAVGSADDTEQKTFYTTLANQIVNLMSDNGSGAGIQFAEDFANAVATAHVAERRNLYASMAANIIVSMSGGNPGSTFAAAFVKALPGTAGVTNFYFALGEKFHSNPATPAATNALAEFLNSLSSDAKLAIKNAL